MSRKSKQDIAEEKTKLISITATINCGWCDTEVEIKSLEFGSSDSPCELCGSHGEIHFGFKCPNCGEYSQIELSSW